MLEHILQFSIKNRWLILLLTAMAAAMGVYSINKLPIDAVPDITNNQVQINIACAVAVAHRGREAGHVPDRELRLRVFQGFNRRGRCRATALRR